MKHYLLNLFKLKTFLLFFLLQSCFGGPVDKIDLLDMDGFGEQLRVLRSGDKMDTIYVDSLSITLDSIVVTDEKCID